MAKDPAFLFYPGDYISGTMGMTYEEKGAYVDLLMMQFNRGHMTKHMIAQTVGPIWDNIKDKFEVDQDGKFWNRRLEEEQIKRKAFTQSRRNNKKGTNQHSKKEGHTTPRMEDKDKDKDKSISNNILKEKNDLIKNEILSGGIWVETMMKAHPKILLTEDIFHEKFDQFWIEQYEGHVIEDSNKKISEIKKHFNNTVKKDNLKGPNKQSYGEKLSTKI